MIPKDCRKLKFFTKRRFSVSHNTRKTKQNKLNYFEQGVPSDDSRKNNSHEQYPNILIYPEPLPRETAHQAIRKQSITRIVERNCETC